MRSFRISIVVNPLLLLALLLQTGCSVLVGNVRPEDVKSHSYGIADLSRENPDWVKLDPSSIGGVQPGVDPATTSTEVSDVAYQSKSTAAIISLNSACRNGRDSAEKNLRTLTNVLFLGATNVTLRTEKNLTVQGTPALQTTLAGQISNEKVKLRAVVLRRQTCVYDLVYVSRPRFFDRQASVFSHFVASLRLK